MKAIALEEGEHQITMPDEPIIHLVEGECPYLWIGNNSATSKFCFATLTNRSALRKLANAILRATEKESKLISDNQRDTFSVPIADADPDQIECTYDDR